MIVLVLVLLSGLLIINALLDCLVLSLGLVGGLGQVMGFGVGELRGLVTLLFVVLGLGFLSKMMGLGSWVLGGFLVTCML